MRRRGKAHLQVTDPEVVKPVAAPFVPGRDPISKARIRNETAPNPEPQLLPMNVAYLRSLHKTRRPAPGHFRGFLPVPNSCLYGGIRPTARGNGASDITIWSREFDRLPILHFPVHRLWSVAAPMAADLQLWLSPEEVVKRGKRCGSTSSLVNLIYKRSD